MFTNTRLTNLENEVAAIKASNAVLPEKIRLLLLDKATNLYDKVVRLEQKLESFSRKLDSVALLLDENASQQQIQHPPLLRAVVMKIG